MFFKFLLFQLVVAHLLEQCSPVVSVMLWHVHVKRTTASSNRIKKTEYWLRTAETDYVSLRGQADCIIGFDDNGRVLPQTSPEIPCTLSTFAAMHTKTPIFSLLPVSC